MPEATAQPSEDFQRGTRRQPSPPTGRQGEPSEPEADRVGRGSLGGQPVVAADWNSPEVNESIARDFGLA